MKNSSMRRATLGLAAIAATVAMYACSASGHAEGTMEIRPPFVDPIRLSFRAANDGTTVCEANGGPGHANKCVEITWSDSEGNTLGTTKYQSDDNGAISGPVPPGAVRWQVDVVDCPEPAEEEGESDDAQNSGAFAGGLTSGLVQQGQSPKLFHLPLRDHLIQGGPIFPSDADGDVNLTYCFIVRASSSAQARALVKPIVNGGIGTPVPPSVKVISFATLEADLSGGRFVQAQPGQFQTWSLDFNQGAFYADMSTALNYQLNGWDVLETVIPLSAFDFGVTPGVTYSNSGTAEYQTNLLQEPVSGTYTYSFSL